MSEEEENLYKQYEELLEKFSFVEKMVNTTKYVVDEMDNLTGKKELLQNIIRTTKWILKQMEKKKSKWKMEKDKIYKKLNPKTNLKT